MALLNLTAISCLILLTFTLNSGIAQAAIPTQYPANISIPVYCKNDHQFYCWETDDCRPANTRCDGIEQCPKGEDELNCPACTADNAEDYDKFFCPPENKCIPRMWRCDGTPDCNSTTPTSADEVGCDEGTATCKDDDFVCGDNKCIPTEWKCDEQTDCDDGSDETEALCKGTCAPSEFLCPAHNGTASRCIATTWKCDGEPDCAGGEDELGCGKLECPTGTFNCTGENICLTTAWLCDGDDDCSSGDDEANCDTTASPTQNTCTDFEFACKSGECILSSWMCDNDPDCLDGSDEAECEPKKTECDDTSEFYCTADDRCIPSFLTCSGQSECSDGEDEKLSRCTLPEDELRHCDLNKNEFPCESQIYKTKCVDFSLTCDGKQDCTSGRDENPEFCSGDNIEDQCVGQPCGSDSLVQCKNVISTYTDTNNNPSNRTLGTTCHCPAGYEYNSHNKECIDIDECKNQEMPVCDQLCLNEQGSYRCACQEGYQLSVDGRSCKVTGSVHPKLLFTNRHAIRSMHIHTGNHAEYMPLMNSKAAVALDFDYVAGEVYYSDIDEKKLFKFSLPTADQEEEVEKVDLRIPGVQVPDGLAYDWIYKHLYWTDTSSNSINMACIDDDVTTGDVAPRRVMMLYNNSNPDCAKLPANSTSMEVCIDEPRALVVHPHKGWVFWSDWGNKAHIAFGHLDGSHKEMIAYNTDDNKHYLGWPNGLTLDTSGNNEKLYWIDAKLHSIFSCSVDHCLGDIQALTYDHDKIIHPYSITVFENHLYWSDWHHQWITMANKYTGGNMTSVITNIRQPMDLKVFHPMAQQNGTNHCKDDEGNALCSQLCFPKPWTKDSRTSTFVRVPDAEKQYTCKCTKEYTLQADGRSCSLTNPTHIPRTNDEGDDSKIETGTASKHTGEEDSGSMNIGTVAAIAASAVFLIGVVIAVAAVVGVRRHRMQKNKNMNFDNPIYKRTTEDKLELPRHEYQPSQTEPSAMVPLTSSEGASTSDNLDV